MATEIDTYEDPIISLANDPNLNKEVDKTNKLIGLISGFSLAERKVSKLCQLSLTILQTLEKIELNLKNWAFLSLDINSNDHFNNDNTNIKDFNNSISMKVLTDCHEMNKKLSKISVDLDYITKALKSLTPIEYILDSGTLLTSLTLRNIKLKHELTDKVTVAYLKAKLITIGTELEGMLTDDQSDTTVNTYKAFVASLLKQLNSAIEDEDMTEKHECLAVISDMEKMFDAFKLEKAEEAFKEEQERQREETERALKEQAKALLQLEPPHHAHHMHATKSPRLDIQSPKFSHNQSEDDSDSIYDLEMGSSMYGSTYTAPMIHSITKSQPAHAQQTRHSVEPLSASGSSFLHKTTIAEEMPYLMSAFDLARNVEEDIRNFKEEDDTKSESKSKSPKSDLKSSLSDDSSTLSGRSSVHYPSHKSNLRETPLTSESTILQEPPKNSAFSYLYSNNSLLSRLGIRPQVITTDLPTQQTGRELGLNTSVNITPQRAKPRQEITNGTKGTIEDKTEKDDKENTMIKPLTQKNLATHTFSSLNVINDFNDHVE